MGRPEFPLRGSRLSTATGGHERARCLCLSCSLKAVLREVLMSTARKAASPLTAEKRNKKIGRTFRDPSADASQGQLQQWAINTIRTLSIDAVQQANSGHPGTPMGLAPVAYTVWQNFLRFDPEDPKWPNRDRFVLSNGHASMLLYSMLFLTGVKDAHGALRAHTRRHQAFPPDRQQNAWPS